MDRFTDRTAVITGGAGGIGKATALRLASEGANVVVVDMNQAAVDAVAAEVGGLGVVADVTDAEDVARMSANAHIKKTRVTILTTNGIQGGILKRNLKEQGSLALVTPSLSWHISS